MGGSDRSDREMGFELLAENARQREAQLDSTLTDNRARSLEAVRHALNRPAESDSAWVAPARRRIANPAGTQAASLLSQDAMTQQILSGTRARTARAAALEQSVNRYRVEIHKKLAIAIACLVFTLIGPPLSLLFPRGGVGFVVSGSAVIFFVYWVGLLVGEAAADRRLADPAVTMWMGNVIMGAAGVLLVARMGRAGVTTRGGTDLGETVGRLAERLFVGRLGRALWRRA